MLSEPQGRALGGGIGVRLGERFAGLRRTSLEVDGIGGTNETRPHHPEGWGYQDVGFNGVYNDASNEPDLACGVGRRHLKGADLLGFSGHVVFIRFETFERERESKPGLLWCVPDDPCGGATR